MKVGNLTGTFALYTGSGYLYAASSSENYLKTKETLDNNASWKISISADGTATITAQGTNTRNVLKYNSQNSLFSCYSSGQADVSIYKFVDGSSVPETPACEHTNTTTTTTATCTEAGTTTVTCDDCGETIGTEVTEATGHTYVDGVCTVCDAKEPGSGEEGGETTTTTVSKSHTDIASIAGVSTSGGNINGKEIKLDDNISIICAKGESTSNPAIYSESIRLYQNGATLTIKGTGMKTIVITLANNAAGDGPISVTGGTADNANAPTNYTYTITVDENAQDQVVITTTGNDKNSRLYVANIEVTYDK